MGMASKTLRFAFTTAAPIQLNRNNLICSSKFLQRISLQYYDGNISASFHTSPTIEHARPGTRVRKRKVAVKNKMLKEARLRKEPKPIPYKVQLMLKAKGL